MMPREELIEKMAIAIIGNAEYSSTPEKQYLMFKNEQPYWNDVAEAALQALLSNLPCHTSGMEVTHSRTTIGLDGKVKVLCEYKEFVDYSARYYKELLRMKK